MYGIRRDFLVRTTKSEPNWPGLWGAVIDTFYEDYEEPVIIDKGRGWPIPTILSAMTQVLGEKPKIIATVRSIPDCMASFVRVAQT